MTKYLLHANYIIRWMQDDVIYITFVWHQDIRYYKTTIDVLYFADNRAMPPTRLQKNSLYTPFIR